MAIQKSELYSSLWKSCDELRGGMDASQYKDYVLVLLFVKYVSDKYAGRPDALIHVPLPFQTHHSRRRTREPQAPQHGSRSSCRPGETVLPHSWKLSGPPVESGTSLW